MDITVPVLLFTSALIGAAAGLRYKVFVLMPLAFLIALGAAAILRRNDFATESGIATITACLVLNQAAYMIVQFFDPSSHLISDDGADSEPSANREQGVHGDDGDDNQKPATNSGSSELKSRDGRSVLTK
jgi:hypothetical protein